MAGSNKGVWQHQAIHAGHYSGSSTRTQKWSTQKDAISNHNSGHGPQNSPKRKKCTLIPFRMQNPTRNRIQTYIKAYTHHTQPKIRFAVKTGMLPKGCKRMYWREQSTWKYVRQKLKISSRISFRAKRNNHTWKEGLRKVLQIRAVSSNRYSKARNLEDYINGNYIWNLKLFWAWIYWVL